MDFTEDYYAVLGILPSADEAIIKAVYRALAKKWHPDTFAGDKSTAEAKLKDINEAYRVLSDTKSRAEYDAQRHGATSDQQREYEGPDENDRAPFEAELAADWAFVLEYYPNVERMRLELSAFSSALALAFQVGLLEHKAFPLAEAMKRDLIEQFMRTFFGSNIRIREFAARLIRAGKKAAAKELNRLIRVSGSPSDDDAKRIIEKIDEKFDPWGEHRSRASGVDIYASAVAALERTNAARAAEARTRAASTTEKHRMSPATLIFVIAVAVVLAVLLV